ncbi:ubiquinol oxidase subunit II [Paracoccus aerodenitrificans]|uniref:ubiquinol oxidase subunit II n=1 Tax=Paracoccus aerodenitrificans TaxID=3017781 RepID=UPI0022F05EB6|nr:ubiquinol oxidase subunit II [Paracoccus aerodenitrificans]WBU63997.1 ubiquinol oxidase subunit II [Paracoccus aerodenitrificans]
MAISKFLLRAAPLMAVAGCGSEVLAPGGDVAAKTRDVLGITTALILVIVLPVMIAIVVFAIRYRSSNKDSEAEYDPGFHHSTQLELLIWAAPLVIIVWLGALTWVSTHKLDPYRPLDSETAGVTDGEEPLVVQVVAMDWKWLFIYPEYGIATVNDLAAPLDRPIRFELTATQVMTAFYVPTLAGMIYAMPSMQTQLHAVINEPGDYTGMAAHYTGAGFPGMKFPFHGMEQADFDAWVEKSRDSGEVLDRDEYLELLAPSENVPATFYALGDEELYHDILNRCVEPGQTCMDEMMMTDKLTRSRGSAYAASAVEAAGGHQPETAAEAEAETEAPHWGEGGGGPEIPAEDAEQEPTTQAADAASN